MKKYITAIFPLILCAVPSYAAQWSCPSCTKAELQALFEKHVASDRLEGVLQVFNSNLSDNGVLKSDGIAKTCIATWGRGGLGTSQYKNCEKLAIDLINLAKNKNAKTYNKNVVAWRDIPNIVGLELEKPAAKCSKKSTNLIYKGNRAWEIVCDGITHNFKFAEVTCESGETFNEQKGECEQSNTKLAKSPASKKPAGTPDTEYKPDGVEILSSGYVVPVNEFPHRGEAVNRAKQVLKQQTGVDYKCGAPRQHETEVLCQHPTNTSVYVKVKFAGFTDSESTSTPKESPAPAAASGQPSASNVSGTLSDADRQRCLQGALESQARMQRRALDIMFMGRGYESISNVDVECSVSDSKCVLNQHATKDGTVVYAHMCINIQIHGTDVCKVSTSANGSSVLFSGSVSSSTSALRTGSKPASVRDCP